MTGFARVAGRCPACNGETLFLGSGNYVTCSWIECPRPTMVAEYLDGGFKSAEQEVARLRGFFDWLLTLDDPEDSIGREERRSVTLTKIIDRARAALSEGGES